MENRKIRYAIVGAGKHALDVFIPAIGESYNSELVAVLQSGKLLDGIERGIAIRNATVVSDLKQIIDDQSIDVVYVAAPNFVHADIVVEALRAGKHVLCEKPLCYLLEDLERVEFALEQSSGLLMTGFMYRLHPQMELVRGLIKGADVKELKLIFTYNLSEEVENIRNSPKLGGGVLLDLGCYVIDLLQFLIGFEFNDSLNLQLLSSAAVDREIALVDLGEGPRIDILISQERAIEQHLRIVSETLQINIPTPFLIPRKKKLFIEVKDLLANKVRKIEFEPFNQVLSQINLFSECIQNGAGLLFPLTDGVENARVLTHYYQKIHV